MRGNNLNLYRTANEAQTIGDTTPINMSRVSDNLLKAASPASFSLLDNTKINGDSSDAAAAACRSYKDIAGLRRLQKDQVNKTHYDPKCGWIYKPSTGLYPEISQGALGTAAGPSFGQQGSPDEVAGGAQWFWKLGDAEKKITTKICANASKCKQLSLLGRYADVCGYCKTTGAIIPTVGGQARYPKSTTAGCLKKDIVSAGGSCPEGFTSFRQGNLNEAFQVREGFGSLDDLNNCMEMPLTRDCVVKAAQNAGCSPDGALIQALKGSTGDYDSKLKTNSAYNSYNSFMPFTAGLMKDGSVAAINVALDDFGRLMNNTQSGNTKVSLASKDLCIRAGEFDKYDFCAEMAIDTVINKDNISCVEKVWGQNGGTKQGTAAPTLAMWNGKKFGDFLASGFVRLMQTNSNDKNTNASALMGIVGTDSSTQATRPGIDLPMDETTRGGETVWFDLGNVGQSGAPVVILKCDLRLKKDTSTTAGPEGEVLPFVGTWTEMINKYNFTNQNNKAYTSAFEIRTGAPNDNQVIFGITTDDGFMLSKNQNPFENAGKGPDWGSWRYQGPSVYYSPAYSIGAEQTNIFVTKWFQGYGEAASHFWMYRPTTGWIRGCYSSDVYLTQEPLAPWCQYELCARPNSGAGTSVGFFEKRWNGPSAMDYTGTPTSGFDVTTGSVVFQTEPRLREAVPGQKAFASFVSNSYWHTKSFFHFNAFRTITLLIRPIANLSPGGAASVYHHCNFRGFSAGMYLRNNGGHYALDFGTSRGQFQGEHFVEMNQWNLIVIQYIGGEYGVTKMTCNVEPLSRIQSDSGRRALLAKLSAGRTSAGSVFIGNPREDPFANSGMLLMGALDSRIYYGFNSYVPSFTGDVAWVHGFRNYLDSDLVLKNEITQGWISRWAIPNLPNDITLPEKDVYGNNGSVTCERYCGGVGGGPWNGELPVNWNGAKCIGTPGSSLGCNSGSSSGIVCRCQRTGRGWN